MASEKIPPPWIIEEIRKREEEKRRRDDRPQPQLPVPMPPPPSPKKDIDGGDAPDKDRGVVIIDPAEDESDNCGAVVIRFI